MNAHFDEVDLTAYVLGELSSQDAGKIEEAIASSPEAWACVEETRQLASMLRNDFRAELRESKPLNVMPLAGPRSFWSDERWLPLGIAAVLAVLALVSAVFLAKGRAARELTRRGEAMWRPDIQMEFEAEEPFGDEGDAATSDDAFHSAQSDRISTFALNVGTDSYATVQRFIANGSLPPRDAVRIEEMMNYFTYDEARPHAGEALSIATEAADCPWQSGHRIVRIGISAREGANATDIVAQEASVQVEFNPAVVAQYRLIGFQRGERSHAEDIVAGHHVTALYELVPTNGAAENEMLAVRVNYRDPTTGALRAVEKQVVNSVIAFSDASTDLKFAAAVAEFGMVLRNSPERGLANFDQVMQCAQAGRGADVARRREAFIDLVRQAVRLTNG